MQEAESLLVVLSTMGGKCLLKMEYRKEVAPLYFSLGGEDMVNLVDPVTGIIQVSVHACSSVG